MPNIADSMKEWAYTFDSVSKEAWLDQVEKDLRGKPLESLLGEWWPGEPLQPLIHAADADQQIIRLPDHLFAKPPSIAERIAAQSSSVNADIHEALRYGAEKIIISCHDIKVGDLSQWLDGVHLDMVSVQLELEDISVVDPVVLSKELLPNVVMRIKRNTSSINELEAITSKLTGAGIDSAIIRYMYSVSSEGKWDQKTIDTLHVLLRDLKNWINSGWKAEDFFKKAVLELDCHPTYFKQIIQTRVLHLIWLNLLEQYKTDPSAIRHDYLEGHIQSQDIDNPDKYLISASLSGLAASLSGTCSLCIHHLTHPDIKPFYKRSNRNIQHLLHLESNMYQGTDPLAGAYAIDLYSKQWTRRIWEGLTF